MKKGLGVILLLISFGLIALGTYFLFNDKEFTVEFLGIDKPYTVKVKNNSYLKIPETPTKENYVFDGWYCDGKEFDFNSKITSDLKIQAVWLEITENMDDSLKTDFNILFKDEEVNIISSSVVQKGSVVQKPDDPIKDGYKFVGWFNNESEYDFNLEVTSDLILVAKFEK